MPRCGFKAYNIGFSLCRDMYHLTDSSTDCPAIDSVDEALSTHESTTSTGLHINHYNQEHSTDGLSATTEIGLRHNIDEHNTDADTLVVIEAYGNEQHIGRYVHNDRCDTNFDKVEKWLTATLEGLHIGEKIDHDTGSVWAHGHATSATEYTSAGESHASYTKKVSCQDDKTKKKVMTKVVLRVSCQDDKTKQKVMKKMSGIYGVESISMDMKEYKLTMIGDFDPLNVMVKVRTVSHAEFLSIGPEKMPERNNQSEEDDPTKLKAELIKAYGAEEGHPNRCVIC